MPAHVRNLRGATGHVGELVKPQRLQAFLDSYMRMSNAGTPDLATKIGKAFGAQQRPFSGSELERYLDAVYHSGKGSPVWRVWYAEKQGGNPNEAKKLADDVVANAATEEDVRNRFAAVLAQLKSAQQERDDLVRERNDNVTSRGDHEEAMRYLAERNAALTRRSEAEHATSLALGRAAAAESRVGALEEEARKSASESGRLRAEVARQQGLLVRQENRIGELQAEVDSKHIALQSATRAAAKAEAAVEVAKKAAEIEAREATSIRKKVVLTAVPRESSPASVEALLEELVADGRMSFSEAMAKARGVK